MTPKTLRSIYRTIHFECKCSSILWFMFFCYVKFSFIENSLFRRFRTLFKTIYSFVSTFKCEHFIDTFSWHWICYQPFILQCFWYSATIKEKLTTTKEREKILGFVCNEYILLSCLNVHSGMKYTLHDNSPQWQNKEEIKKCSIRIFNILFL